MRCGAQQVGSIGRAPSKRHGCWYYVLMVIGVFFVIGMAVSIIQKFVTKPPTPAEQKQQNKTAINVTLAAEGAKRLQKAMRNPDSFKLSQVLIMDDDAVCYEYRAQNGFGGMNVGRAVLAPDGQFAASETPKFRALWKKECAQKTGLDRTSAVGTVADIPTTPSDK